MKLPTRKEVENDAIQFANSSPRHATFVNGWMKCYERFIEPLTQVNDADTSQDKALNLADVSNSALLDIKKICNDTEELSSNFTDEQAINCDIALTQILEIINETLP